MTAKWPLPFVLMFGVTATRAAGPVVTIDTASEVESGFTYTVPKHAVVVVTMRTR